MKRVIVLGSGGAIGAAAAAALLASLQELPDPVQPDPGPKNRAVRGPALQEPEPWGAGGRKRAQWKDERQRGGRQR